MIRKLIALIKAYAYIIFVRPDCRVLRGYNAHGMDFVGVIKNYCKDDTLDFELIVIFYNPGNTCKFAK